MTALRPALWALSAGAMLALGGCWDAERELDHDADKAARWGGRATDRAGDAFDDAARSTDNAAERAEDWQQRAARREQPAADEVGRVTALAYVAVLRESLAGEDATRRAPPPENPGHAPVPAVRTIPAFTATAPDPAAIAAVRREHIVQDHVHDLLGAQIEISPTCALEWTAWNGQVRLTVIYCFRLTTKPWKDEEADATAFAERDCAGIWATMVKQGCDQRDALVYRLQFFAPDGSKASEIARGYRPPDAR